MNATEVSTSRPRVTVAAVIERDGRFLIVQEPKNQKVVFNQPAGHVEANETLIEAVVREVKEETAWDFTPEFLTGIYEWYNAKNGKTYLRTTFTGTVTNHDPKQQLFDGILDAAWMTPEELQAQRDTLRSPMVLRCIEDYLAGTRFPLNLITSL
jgi:8-oxo-dGTP pyrophosphatase MutT (NUDIX family)